MSAASLERMVIRLSGRSDILIAVFVMMVVFLMIMPVPTMLVDMLIAINMSVAVVLIMVSVYLPSPLSFSAFPAVLLLTTLFRLALSITTTRLILLQADAGSIVEAFGNFVVGGNMVVGLVVFLIITVVQFIVITKGSERVAEVGARFSLDAMPGKQMSIDGDMRSGVIDMEEASEKRRALEKESQLYGAMDGALKFVKGDAIAGIIIIIVNILGGITIGTMQQGMSAGEAAQLYSILTVGDGLVAQIPALLISITAGIIVTRVSVDDHSNVGNDIANQVLSQPLALMIGSVLLLGFAIIPGFPTTIFLILSLLVGAVGYTLSSVRSKENQGKYGLFSASSGGIEGGGSGSKEHSETSADFTMSAPLLIEVDEDVKGRLETDRLNSELSRTRKALYQDLGIPFPGIDLVFRSDLTKGVYKILLDEVPVAQGELKDGYVIAQETTENLDIQGYDYILGEKILPNMDTIWVEETECDSLRKSDINYLEPTNIITYHLALVLRRYSADFIGIQETRYIVEQVEKEFPELVKEVQRLVPIQKMAEIFQRLVAEDISIRNMRLVFQSLVEWGQTEKDPILLAEYVRSSLKRHISFKYSSGQNILAAFMIDPSVEELVRNGIRQTSSGSYLALEPEQTASILEKVKECVGDLSGHMGTPIILTSMDVRRYVRRLIEGEYYDLPVLSYQEITNEITVQPLSRISL